jgi:hypothetical protein
VYRATPAGRVAEGRCKRAQVENVARQHKKSLPKGEAGCVKSQTKSVRHHKRKGAGAALHMPTLDKQKEDRQAQHSMTLGGLDRSMSSCSLMDGTSCEGREDESTSLTLTAYTFRLSDAAKTPTSARLHEASDSLSHVRRWQDFRRPADEERG